MHCKRFMFGLVAVVALCSATFLVRAADGPAAGTSLGQPDAEGFISLFNGQDLSGWEGLEGYWSVKDGAISGSQTRENSKQTFLILSASKSDPARFSNFELRLKYQFVGNTGNSGVQFRSKVMDAATFRVGGYQADFDPDRRYDGGLYDEGGQAGGRAIMANRGFKTTWDAANTRTNEPLAENAQQTLREAVNPPGQWNDLTIIANGPRITIRINGQLMSEVIDQSPAALKDGLIALQLHQGHTMDIRARDIRIKLLDAPTP